MPSFDQSFCRLFGVLPQQRETNTLELLVSAESDVAVVDYIQKSSHLHVSIKDIEPEQLAEQMDLTFGDSQANFAAEAGEQNDGGGNQHSPIVAKINGLLHQALDRRASDIHFEPREGSMVCRHRIDGVLLKQQELQKKDVPEVISRLKIMAGLDIAEKRRPQDGRIRFNHKGRTIDIRVSVIPTDFGEKAVLRLLDKQSLKLDLESLGFADGQLGIFQESISASNGIVLVTGPTGSGKTTTLYAALCAIKSPEVNISTVEDPIEYNLEGINQSQVKPEINVTFASMLRALLRQDPDIIMVGEIRDPETLEMATRASLTGHLVFSTIHTNDAPSTVTRLKNMAADPQVLSSTIRLVVAQRLVRRICPSCGNTDESETTRAAARKLGIADTVKLTRGGGCEHCNETGYFGRAAIFELVNADTAVRDAIVGDDSETTIRGIMQKRKLPSLMQQAVSLVEQRVTTPQEVLREVHV